MQPLQSCLLKKLDRTIEREASISPIELHSFEIYARVTEIENNFQSLQIALEAIKAISHSPTPSIDQYRYHAENIHLRLTGIYDRACRLTGICIGMEATIVDCPTGNREVSKRLRHHNMHSTQTVLSDVKSLTEPFRKMRNRIAHESELSSDWMRVFTALPQINTKEIGVLAHSLLVDHIKNEIGIYDQLFRDLVNSINQLIKELSPRFLTKAL